MKNTLKNLLPALWIIPFIVGSIGHLKAGEPLTDALYHSFALYVTNQMTKEYNLLIEIARWTAPLSTATMILSVFENAWKNILWWFKCLARDSVAVYTDSDMEVFLAPGAKAIYPGRNLKKAAKSHVILLGSDAESLQFYETNKGALQGKAVYIGLQEIDPGLVKENGSVSFFDLNGTIARMLWKELCLWGRGQKELSVAVYGSGCLAERILSSGLLLNLYAADQHITYHMVSDDTFRLQYPDLPLFNNDEIRFYHETDDAGWEAIRSADIVILADPVPAEKLQTLVVNCKKAEKVYYYSKHSGDSGDCIQFRGLTPFGRNSEILTDANIRQEKLLESAKQLHLSYSAQVKNAPTWSQLDGFTKWSNISSADYNEILAELFRRDPGIDPEMLAELEHIRWSRFHYLNYWSFGIPEDKNANKDPQKKIHKLLVPFSALPEAEKDKDRRTVSAARERALQQP